MERTTFNMEALTVEECIELYKFKGIITVISDGKVVALINE